MGKIVCPYCERACCLGEGDVGVCRAYWAQDGQVRERFPQLYSSLGISHIESVPFYHFQPGSRTLLLGGAGCNFDCQYCSNAYVARAAPENLLAYHMPPERVLRFARQYGCHNISFAVNEPTMALPTLLDLAKACAGAGLTMGVLTNGYVTPEIAEEMGKAFAFVNVSIKGMSDEFYRQNVGPVRPAVVLRNIEILHRLTHVEVSTPIVQGLNDDDIGPIADFIAALDSRIPWHVFRLLPEYKMANRQRPSIAKINAALEDARRRLPYIYFGNFVGSQWVSTLCPKCGSTVIERYNTGGCTSKLRRCTLDGTRCSVCGHSLPIVGGYVDWNSLDAAQTTEDGETWKSA